MKTVVSLGIILGLFSACTPASIQARKPPHEVLALASKRLAEHNIKIDPTGAQGHHLKSMMYCYRDADLQGFQWSRAFGLPAPIPIGFEFEGRQDDQDKRLKQCARIVRILVQAEPTPQGSRVTVSSDWWALKMGRCTPIGNPLLGSLKCRYSYTGSRPPRDVRGYIYGLLKGL